MTASAEMPRYKSHKTVWALQIGMADLDIQPDGGTQLTFMDRRFSPRFVSKEVIARYLPRPGDYLVIYADGYESISPQKAFEEGYTLESDDPAAASPAVIPENLRIEALRLAHSGHHSDFSFGGVMSRARDNLRFLMGASNETDQVS